MVQKLWVKSIRESHVQLYGTNVIALYSRLGPDLRFFKMSEVLFLNLFFFEGPLEKTKQNKPALLNI